MSCSSTNGLNISVKLTLPIIESENENQEDDYLIRQYVNEKPDCLIFWLVTYVTYGVKNQTGDTTWETTALAIKRTDCQCYVTGL